MTASASEANSSKMWPGRIVHLVDGSRGNGSSGMLHHVEELILERPQDRIALVGGTSAARYGRLSVHSKFSGFQSSGLKRFILKTMQGSNPPDIIHAWGISSAALVSELPSSQAIAISVDGFDSAHQDAHRAAAVMLSGRAAATFGSRRSLKVAMDLVGGNRVGSGGEVVVCPVRDPERVHARDEELRQSWGATPESKILGIIGSPMEHLNLFDFGSIGPRYSVFQPHVILIASSRGARRGDFIRWLESAGLGVELVFDDRIELTHRVVKSLDMAVAPSSMACRHRICDVAPVLATASAGIPVVLGVDHPADDLANHPLVHRSVMHGEHMATKWLVKTLGDAPSVEHACGVRQRETYLQELAALYDRAASLSGASSVTAAS